MINEKVMFHTAKELVELGRDNIPKDLKSGTGLVYSSPATLAYNSPGAEGFGVKRAGLSIPGSVMLIVSPGCCGRNTSEISIIPRYKHRFFYLDMNENDLITGKHLSKIPQAVTEVVDTITNRWEEEKPDVVMICITCVDALLGTDMERVCKKATEASGVLVKPCYMYALTREGRKPPMVHVRQSIYSLLDDRKRKGNSVNFLGFFAPLIDDFELYDYFKKAGVANIREIGRCDTFDEFMEMSEANFNIVLNPEAVAAAEDLKLRRKMPYIEIKRLYYIEQIRKQYYALANALGITIDDEKEYNETLEVIERVKSKKSDIKFAIGESLNADSFELALALLRYGFSVIEIYGLFEEAKFNYIEKINELSPDTRIYSNMDPTMMYYEEGEKPDIVIGKDAAFYHKDSYVIGWNEDIQPYGYAGLKKLFLEIEKSL